MLTAFQIALGKLVALAYDPLFTTDPAGVDVSLVDGGSFSRLETLFADDPGGDAVPYGIVASHPLGTAVAIRGTGTQVEWLADAEAIRQEWPRFFPGARAHKGFLDIYETMRTSKGIPASIYLAGKGPLFVAGHSLGSALATLLATDLAADLLVAYASPRLFDRDTAERAEKVVKIIARPVIPGDIVTELPPAPLFWHVADPIYLQTPPMLNCVMCRHSLSTYLHAVDTTVPLESGCAP